MILYILQVILFQIAFLLMYNFFFQKETFYTYNRFYLLITPLLSIALPMIQIESLKRHVPADLVLSLTAARENVDATIQLAQTITLSNILLAIWIVGSIIFLLRFIYQNYKIYKVINTNRSKEDKQYKYVELLNSKNAYSFFNYIFLGDQLEESQREIIKSHELIHANYKHSYDIIYFELLKIVFWFNPINYIMNQKLKALHEFSVDSKLTIKKDKNAYYQSLLLQIFDVENISFTNHFFHQSLIKNRIIMLQKSKSKRIFLVKYILLIPALSFMLVYTSCKAQAQSEIIDNVKTLRQSIAKQGNLTDEEMKELKVLYALTMDDGLTNPLLSDVRDHLDIPSGVLPTFPVSQGCTGENAELKACLADQIVKLIEANLDENELKKFNKMSQIGLTFRLDTKGDASMANVNIKNASLKEKMEMIINTKLNNIEPAKLQNTEVGVLMDMTIK